MEFELEFDSRLPRGGRARGGSGAIHLSFRSGSRSGGASARAAFAYISRNDEYANSDRDAALYTESDHMPSWAHDDATRYWDSADLYERANGRLYVSADFALPRDLKLDDQIALAREFAEALTDREHLPYTVSIHAGRDEDGHEHNPHAHLMFSERKNDGVDRTPEQWFRRTNVEHPERGGAPKSRTFHGRDWVEQARERWASLTNATLERVGRSDRVDHRSYERQGINREPGRHYGPSAPHMVAREQNHDHLSSAATIRDHEDRMRTLDQEIAELEAVRRVLIRGGLPELERDPKHGDDSRSRGGDRHNDDRSRGR